MRIFFEIAHASLTLFEFGIELHSGRKIAYLRLALILIELALPFVLLALA